MKKKSKSKDQNSAHGLRHSFAESPQMPPCPTGSEPSGLRGRLARPCVGKGQSHTAHSDLCSTLTRRTVRGGPGPEHHFSGGVGSVCLPRQVQESDVTPSLPSTVVVTLDPVAGS